MHNVQSMRLRRALAMGLVVGLAALGGSAQDRGRARETERTPDQAPGATARVDELSAQDKEVLSWTNEFAKEVTRIVEGWLTNGSVTQDRFFSFLYYPVVDTDPTKYTTDYDTLSDRDIQGVLDKYVGKSNLLMYAVMTDRNGYVPTHNRQYSQPLTGNRAVDLVNNRAKRIFGDQIGFKAARNQKPYLLQTYSRDTGELVSDISVPLTIRGQHWGCVRIGYRAVERQQ